MEGYSWKHNEFAWNDPPPINFKSTTDSNTSARRLKSMRHRVGSDYSIITQSSDSQPVSTTGHPPKDSEIDKKAIEMFGLIAQPSSLKDSIKIDDKETSEINQFDFSPFEKILLDLYQELDSDNGIEPSMKKEIPKRLEILKEMWMKEGFSSNGVKEQVIILVETIGSKDFKRAWKLHQLLMANHTKECSPWMLGIKSLVIAAQNKSPCVQENSYPQLPIFLSKLE